MVEWRPDCSKLRSGRYENGKALMRMEDINYIVARGQYELREWRNKDIYSSRRFFQEREREREQG